MNENERWYTQAIYYQVYIRAYCDSNADGQGDIRGLISRLDYIQDLGVDCIWLMPVFPVSQEDGISGIIDYYNIQKEYGDIRDFEALVEAVHVRNMKLIIEIELNHTSDQHPWFLSSRLNPQSPHRNYYVWSDSNKKFHDARHLSGNTPPTNWHKDPSSEQYYWSRFSASLPELNYDNSEIRTEMVKVMRFWLGKGVDGFCLNGLPFLFEREDTNCENLPENHRYLKAVRAFFDQNFPQQALLGNINQSQQVAAAYFGRGDELHLASYPSLGALLLLALYEQDTNLFKRILDHMPAIPDASQWVCRLAGPEGIPLDQIPGSEQETLRQAYTQNPNVQTDPGIPRRLAAILENDQRIIRLLYTLLFSLPGAPTFYYGEEIGMGDNPYLPGSNGLMAPMQWDETKGAGFSKAVAEDFYLPLVNQPPFDNRMLNVIAQEADPESLLNYMRDMIKTRKDHPELVNGSLEWVDTDNPSVAAFVRRIDESALFIIFNLSDRTCGARIPRELRQEHRMDLLGGYLRLQPDLTNITLKPYQFGWFSI